MWKISLIFGCIFLLNANVLSLTNFSQHDLLASYGKEVVIKFESINSTLSNNCSIQLKEYINGLAQPELWALKMLDATSKLNPGLLTMNVVNYGAFDECINIKENHNGKVINGKYCIGHISAPKMPTRTFSNLLNHETTPQVSGGSIPFALCIPDICTEQDVMKVMSSIGLEFTENHGYCQSTTTSPTLDTGDVAVIVLLVCLALIAIASTVYGLFIQYGRVTPYPIYTSFSIILNTKKLLSVKENSDTLSCIHGLRVLSIMWIILGHRYVVFFSTGITNYMDLYEWLHSKKSMFLLGSTVSVDTFFVISGTVLSYTYMTARQNGAKFNILNFYISRYIRLTPALLMLILFILTLSKFTGDGPLWNIMVKQHSGACESYWWTTVLYIQNYVKPMEICVPQSWYLSTDFQFYILSPLLLLPLVKKPKLTFGIIGALIFICMTVTFIVVWINGLRIFPITGEKMEEFQRYYYTALYSRVTPWLLGFILGYILFFFKQENYQQYIQTIKDKPIVNVVVASLWIFCLLTLVLCVFAGHDLMIESTYDKVGNALNMTFLRPAWALAISWIIFACVVGFGGPINLFLSSPLFQVLAKLTYSMYLVHTEVILAVAGQIRQPEEFAFLTMTYKFCGDFILTTIAAYVLCILFESPIIIIQKYLIGRN